MVRIADSMRANELLLCGRRFNSPCLIASTPTSSPSCCAAASGSTTDAIHGHILGLEAASTSLLRLHLLSRLSTLFLTSVHIFNLHPPQVVVIKQFDDGSKEKSFPYIVAAGIERYPQKVTKRMGAKKIAKRSKVKPFVKVISYNHLMPTRYALELEGLKGAVTQDTFKEPSQREDAKKQIKQIFEEKYTSGKNKCSSPLSDSKRLAFRFGLCTPFSASLHQHSFFHPSVTNLRRDSSFTLLRRFSIGLTARQRCNVTHSAHTPHTH